jgi:hypothetical protein
LKIIDLSIRNDEFPVSSEIEMLFKPENAVPSMKVTLRGITIDFNEQPQNADDSIRFSSELDSNEIDESDSHE